MTRKTVALGGAVIALASLVLAHTPGASTETDDYATLPPEHAVTTEAISALPVTLADAINAAESQLGGKAYSAEFNLEAEPQAIDVVVYKDNTAQRATVDALTGVVREVTDVSRYPGWLEIGEVVELESGVRYWNVVTGEGDLLKPTTDPLIRFHFQGFYVNGKQWGGTYESGQPGEAPIQQLLPGWIEGMQGMRAGGKRKLILPAEHGFGVDGRPPNIPANATLIVDVELLAIVDYQKVPEILPGDDVMDVEPVTTETGLTYYDMECGDGEFIEDPEATVRVHYTGYLNDGTVFDSSVERGQPFEFSLAGGVIPGWIEGVRSMTVGSHRKLVIPFELAYGEYGRPPVIPPKATLIFDIELLEIVEETAPVVDPHEGHDHGSHEGHDHD